MITQGREERTKHAQQMLRAVDLAHLLLLADDDLRAGDVLFAHVRELLPLEAVQEVVPQGFVEVDGEAGDYGWEEGDDVPVRWVGGLI